MSQCCDSSDSEEVRKVIRKTVLDEIIENKDKIISKEDIKEQAKYYKKRLNDLEERHLKKKQSKKPGSQIPFSPQGDFLHPLEIDLESQAQLIGKSLKLNEVMAEDEIEGIQELSSIFNKYDGNILHTDSTVTFDLGEVAKRAMVHIYDAADTYRTQENIDRLTEICKVGVRKYLKEAEHNSRTPSDSVFNIIEQSESGSSFKTNSTTSILSKNIGSRMSDGTSVTKSSKTVPREHFSPESNLSPGNTKNCLTSKSKYPKEALSEQSLASEKSKILFRNTCMETKEKTPRKDFGTSKVTLPLKHAKTQLKSTTPLEQGVSSSIPGTLFSPRSLRTLSNVALPSERDVNLKNLVISSLIRSNSAKPEETLRTEQELQLKNTHLKNLKFLSTPKTDKHKSGTTSATEPNFNLRNLNASFLLESNKTKSGVALPSEQDFNFKNSEFSSSSSSNKNKTKSHKTFSSEVHFNNRLSGVPCTLVNKNTKNTSKNRKQEYSTSHAIFSKRLWSESKSSMPTEWKWTS